jgi:hypothetical protein
VHSFVRGATIMLEFYITFMTVSMGRLEAIKWTFSTRYLLTDTALFNSLRVMRFPKEGVQLRAAEFIAA